MQVIGRPFDEANVLRVAHTYQQVTDWHKKKPEL
jgi:aspartyl-tRNA(Asn)/glutamyl-tRNA(Gln) amidotransferase subunit A